MGDNGDGTPVDFRSNVIARAFAGNKLSPYSDLSALYEFPSIQSCFSGKGDPYYEDTTMVNSARSTFSSFGSVETVHADNGYNFSWSDTAEINTPRQFAVQTASDDPDANLIKVIKTIFTQNILVSLRDYTEEIFKKDVTNMELPPDTEKITVGLEDLRARVFHVLRMCIANGTDINIVQVLEAVKERYEVNYDEDIPSLGSLIHGHGYCKPCVFANKAVNSCNNGIKCNFCHFKHRITRRKNVPKDAQDLEKRQLRESFLKEQQNWAARALPTLQSKGSHLSSLTAAALKSMGFAESTSNPLRTPRKGSSISRTTSVENNNHYQEELLAKCVEYLGHAAGALGHSDDVDIRREIEWDNVDTSKLAVKVYVHPALTLPRTNFQMPELVAQANVEPSRIVGIEQGTTLDWANDAGNAVNFTPSANTHGLTAIFTHAEGDTLVYTGILRMPRELCNGKSYSWTCQGDPRHSAYDGSHCVVVLQAARLEELLERATKAVETKDIALKDPMVRGAFCGNPLLQRIAAGRNSVFMMNGKAAPEAGEDAREGFLCKFSVDSGDLSQCIDFKLRHLQCGMPLALLYNSSADAVATVQYLEESAIHVVAYDGQTLDPKMVFKTLESPSGGWCETRKSRAAGFFINSETYEDIVLFSCDVEYQAKAALLNFVSGHLHKLYRL
ncbi:uncharacterized protein BcabD6B2_47900 [Babesia caballi]|uniref:C3H1-type domain-containing protein n=1 Tax=Babesia caballi TaxID=5871 RepID=A0AAV4M0B2_BABCB|nr:hypothetical protein, conserved [Babesia caballi]